MVSDRGANTSVIPLRKTRGRGLRTKTGCSTCRQRHLKCDETKPTCRNCARQNKTCVYVVESFHAAKDTGGATHASNASNDTVVATHRDNAANVVCEQETLSWDDLPNPEYVSAVTSPSPAPPIRSTPQHVAAVLERQDEQHAFNLTSPISTAGSSVNQPVGLATTKWFDMLVEDANLQLSPHDYTISVQDREFVQDCSHSTSNDEHPPNNPSIPNSNTVTANASTDSYVDRDTYTNYTQTHPWRRDEPLNLDRHEEVLLATFVVHISHWIDHFDPHKHFAALVPRLALHNFGLMSAILALSARHKSVAVDGSIDERSHARDESLRCYHESLRYVRIAMQHTSYHVSEELLATTLIISAYEMLDGSSEDWQRHLQGVFWIQRSQIIHGDSGGLKGAVWWAWLCQDVWAAFRSKRKVFTFWEPVKDFRDLDPAQLAARAVFLLGRVINYCNQGDSSSDISGSISERLQQADALNTLLNSWESCLTPEFSPLPHSNTRQGLYFKPVWIHPPMFASAMQLYNTARLLVCVHQPSLGGFQEGIRRQVLLKKHTDAICGIASMLTDYGSRMASSMCLFIAGMCVREQQARSEILTLLEDCHVMTGWPVKGLNEELSVMWREQKNSSI